MGSLAETGASAAEVAVNVGPDARVTITNAEEET